MTDQVADSAVLQARMAEVLGWQTAHRDDAGVAHELHAAHAVDEVHAIQEAGFIDEFFHYIREIGAWPLLESLDPQKRSRESYPFLQFVLLTIQFPDQERALRRHRVVTRESHRHMRRPPTAPTSTDPGGRTATRRAPTPPATHDAAMETVGERCGATSNGSTSRRLVGTRELKETVWVESGVRCWACPGN